MRLRDLASRMERPPVRPLCGGSAPPCRIPSLKWLRARRLTIESRSACDRSCQRRCRFTISGISEDRLTASARSPPGGPGPERTGGTSGRTRPDRWNIGPHQTGPVEHRAGDGASPWPHTPRRPLQALVSRPQAAGPSCSPAVVFPRPRQRFPGFPSKHSGHRTRVRCLCACAPGPRRTRIGAGAGAAWRCHALAVPGQVSASRRAEISR